MEQNIQAAVQNAFIDLWSEVIGIIPEFIAALAVFIVGLIVASIAGKLTRRLVAFLKVDTLAEHMHVHETLGKMGLTFTFSDVFGKLVKWFFIIVFLNASVEILGWTAVSTFLNDVLRFIPNVVVAVIILAIGLIVSTVVERAVVKSAKSMQSPLKAPDTLGAVAKWAIVTFATIAALTQLEVAEDLLLILFGAVAFALALAFGLAGQDKAKGFLDKLF